MLKLKILASMLVLCGYIYAQADALATVNGAKVTEDDIRIILSNNPNAQFEALPGNVQDDILNRAIERELLIQEASKGDIAKSKEYQDTLAIFKKNLTYNLWLKDKAENMVVSDKEAKTYYNKNKAKYKGEAEIKASHILLKEEKEAKDLIAKLKKSKSLQADFAKAAKEHSTGPSAPNGGDLGWFTADKMVPEFATAAFALKKNTITTAPVKTQFGYHIIYAEAVKGAGQRKLEEVKDEIKNELRTEQFQGYMQKTTEKLRKKAKINVLFKSK